ncbi:MAG TPA: hypothetical protein VF143_11730 [Candidatus Nanopelagicales bacterium]
MVPPARPRRLPLLVASAATAAALLLGGCAAAQEQVGRVAEDLGASAQAEAQRLLDEATGALLPAEGQVAGERRADFRELRLDLERLESQVIALLAAPQDLSAAALEPLQQQLDALEASVRERAAAVTGISAAEQQAWADLASRVQAAAEQVSGFASLLG